MHLDLYKTLAGVIVGFVIALTGMGGGALMTPVLVLMFGVNAGAAVSADRRAGTRHPANSPSQRFVRRFVATARGRWA